MPNMKKEALLYTKLKRNDVQCILCGHRCKISDRKFGFCGVRQNIAGTLYTHIYGEIIASHIDPIEKKPLYHFLPGSQSFSIAAPGCNFRCGFCQNWQISQLKAGSGVFPDGRAFPVADTVNAALSQKCASVSYTYTEPTINFEYCLDVSKLAKAKGLRNVWVTNGFMTLEALTMVQPYMDAANVDLKFFNNGSYKNICAGGLKPVQESIKFMRANNIWVEITTLVVPGKNDSEAELEQISKFIAGVDANIPWHISKFFPNYQYSAYDPTPEGSLRKAFEIGRKSGLRFIYAGNVSGWGGDTYCPFCKKLLVKREGLTILEVNLDHGRCKFCQAQIPGVY